MNKRLSSSQKSIDLKTKRVLVTGGHGFLGKYVVDVLKQRGVKKIFAPTHDEYDLTNRKACEKVVKDQDIVIHLAAQIGGIGFINEKPGEIFYNNLVMGIELMEAARKAAIKKFVSIGTVCEYPKFVKMPFKEKTLWDGYPEETTAPYGLAKKMLIVQAQAYKKQYDFNAINLLPVNLYGPNDNFDKKSSHVIPALIKRFVEAARKNKKEEVVWGSGKATREFLYIEDAAEGIIMATERYDSQEPINLGSGVETPIKDVVELVAKFSGFKGKIVWDKTKPDGQPRRRLDVSKARKFGFSAKTELSDGLHKTIQWYLQKK